MSLGKRLHAVLLEAFNAHYERMVADRKRSLLGGLSGDVLEIGPGTGANICFYSQSIHLIAVEPNLHMHTYLERRARERGIHLDIRTDAAEGLPMADESIDAIVSTLVLCSVTNPEQVVSEIRRVLKPGGKFVFIEHVAADRGSRTRRRQEWIRPIWQWFADGCRPDQETWTFIEAAGFQNVAYERFQLDLPIAGPHMSGTVVK